MVISKELGTDSDALDQDTSFALFRSAVALNPEIGRSVKSWLAVMWIAPAAMSACERCERPLFHAKPTLEATQGQVDDFFGHLQYKYRQNRVASVGDLLQICPWVTFRMDLV